MHKVAFVVPTKDREKDLRVMLSSLERQTHLPDQIVVVDGSEPVIEHVLHDFPRLPINYVRVFPPSLSAQRNAGMAQLREDITLAGYLDDDLELEPDAIEQMLSFWNKASEEYGGASFTITNAPRPPYSRILSIVGLDHPVPGKVLPTGMVSPFGIPQQDINVDWLCGGATVWRRDVIDQYKYDEWFQGTGYLEDVDFSFNVREKKKLAVVALAKTAHYHHPIRPDRYQLLGKWQVINRLYMVTKYRQRGLSPIKAWLVTPFLVLFNILRSLLGGNLNGARCAVGNLKGVAAVVFGDSSSLDGHLK